MNYKLVSIILITMMVTYGCSTPVQTVNPTEGLDMTGTLTQLPLYTEAKPPSSTETPSITSTETAAPSSTPFVPFTASVWAENVNVRTNPGYLFPALRLIAKGTTLTILGKAPGDEWMYAQAPDGKSGWVFTLLIESDVDLEAVPVIEPQDVQLIKGRVVDSMGTPIQGVGFAILQGTGDRPPTNTVLTDANGEFYSFMPLTARDQWTVTYNAIACKSNVWTDDSCSYYKDPYKGLVDPQSTTVSLPQTGVLEFTWK
jgi:SH3-like domain-containing protein